MIDDFNREALGIEVDFSLPSERVIRTLEQHMEWRGKPKVIRCDNGPEYLSTTIVTWTQKLGTRLEYIEPGKPQQNAYIERFNRTARYEWLSQYLWEDGAGSAGSGRLDVDLQSRAPKYGIGRLYEAAAGHGRLVSTSADCGKRGITDGPAIEGLDSRGMKAWYKMVCYNENGPAVANANGRKEWWVEGVKLTEENSMTMSLKIPQR